MPIPVYHFQYKGATSRWSVEQQYDTMTHRITVQIQIPDNHIRLAPGDIAENLYTETVMGLSKALGELKEHLLGNQNP